MEIEVPRDVSAAKKYRELEIENRKLRQLLDVRDAGVMSCVSKKNGRIRPSHKNQNTLNFVTRNDDFHAAKVV